VWFGEFLWQERFAALLDIVRACRPDIVALQEVTPRHLEHLLAVEWLRREFRISDITGSTLQPHGVLLLSRLPLRNLGLQELPSDKDRKILVAEVGLGARSVCVGNLHLESSPQAAPVRLVQLDKILPRLQGAQRTLLMGDFNFDPVQLPEQARVDRYFRDLWAELRPGEPGFTEDTAINGMLLSSKGREKQVRFDRILLRSAVPGWIPASVQLIGTRPVRPRQPELFPSDHFGLAGSVVWSDSVEHAGSG
jgi:endonuclease/exonuclease/phosphatase family metal-dependent hydrolase